MDLGGKPFLTCGEDNLPWQGLSVKETNQQTINQSVNQLGQGRSNAVGTVTLNVSATSTTVEAPTCSTFSVVILSAQTANAAASVTTNYTEAADGSFTITHASNTNADRTYGWIAIG
jgi:hypothetical protein